MNICRATVLVLVLQDCQQGLKKKVSSGQNYVWLFWWSSGLKFWLQLISGSSSSLCFHITSLVNEIYSTLSLSIQVKNMYQQKMIKLKIAELHTSGIRCMFYRFHCLHFNTFICCYDKHNNICNVSTSGSHCFKCCMTRCVDKCYCLLCSWDLDCKWKQKNILNIINKSVRLIMGSLDTKSSMRCGFKSSIRHDILETHLIL